MKHYFEDTQKSGRDGQSGDSHSPDHPILIDDVYEKKDMIKKEDVYSRAKTQHRLSMSIVFSLAIIICTLFLSLTYSSPENIAALKDIGYHAISFFSTLTGLVIGFYFCQSNRK